jgi:K+/H+ antiporter YhaU regulatory subunit KhtT
MKRLLALGLLVGLTASCAIPLRAQRMSVAQYQRNSSKEARKQQKLTKKNAKQQRKVLKRAAKAQKKSLKAAQKADAKANRQLHQK